MVFLFFKVTSDSMMDWELPTIISLAFTVVSVMLVFSLLDYTTKHLLRNYKTRLTDNKTFYKFYLGNCLMAAPFVILASFIHTEVLVPNICVGCPEWEPGLIQTIAQGLVLSWLIILAKTFMIYMNYTRKSEREKVLIQKELAQSKFESLKDQIKPHFLFNSLSVLTSIIEDDPKLAIEFVGRLSKIYRYVLENPSQLVSLKTELQYLEHYIFLLKIRHQGSLEVTFNLDFNTAQYDLPILSLQMLIENALKHNYFSKEAPLHLEIYHEGIEFLVVRNNLKKRELEEEPTKLGLQNIMNRYQMLLDKFIVVKEDDTHFTVKLPLIDPTESNKV